MTIFGRRIRPAWFVLIVLVLILTVVWVWAQPIYEVQYGMPL